MKNITVTILCILITTTIVANAYHQKKQFYPIIVYITRSNLSMAIINIQIFFIMIIIGKLLSKMFFGQLQPIEFERLIEGLWYVIPETGLAFTVFRDDLNLNFLLLFMLLLFFKSFHWLTNARVDFMERSAIISALYHIRIVSLLIILGIVDVLFVWKAIDHTVMHGPAVQLVFGFEYAILFTQIQSIMIKYIFNLNDNNESPWENKPIYLLYSKLIIAFNKLIINYIELAVMIHLYTIPLFTFRQTYFTMREFKKVITDVICSRRAIRNLNTLYPDVSIDELNSIDCICIICREEMHSASKKLPCNHIFHTSCLRSWFQRQQTCPTCRLDVLHTQSVRVDNNVFRNDNNQVPNRNRSSTSNNPINTSNNSSVRPDGRSLRRNSYQHFSKTVQVQTDISGYLHSNTSFTVYKYLQFSDERNKIYIPSTSDLKNSLPLTISFNDKLIVEDYKTIVQNLQIKVKNFKPEEGILEILSIYLNFCMHTQSVITNMGASLEELHDSNIILDEIVDQLNDIKQNIQQYINVYKNNVI